MLDELADDQEVTVSQEELTERIVFQAQQYQMPPEEFVQRIQEAGQLGAIYADVRRSKALIAAVRAATVTDASGTALDMAELLGDADEAQRAAPTRPPETAADDETDASAARETSRRTRRLWTPERHAHSEHGGRRTAGGDACRRVGSEPYR